MKRLVNFDEICYTDCNYSREVGADMRKKFYFVFIYLIYFMGIIHVQALTGVVNVNDSLTLRSAPSTGGARLTSFYNNTELTILDTNAGSGNGCSGNWYKVSYGTYTGYSCGDYINIKPENTSINYNSDDDSYNRNNYSSALNVDGTIMCYEDAGSLSLRSSANGGRTGSYVNCGDKVNILGTEDTPNMTCPYWYQINYNGNVGYVCGYYVNTTKLSSTAVRYYANQTNGDTKDGYQKKLADAGFPSSYFPYLLELHARHPNWNFIAERIHLNFDDVIYGENVNGRSLLEFSAFKEGYASLASHTFHVTNNQFSGYSSEPGYTNASTEAIAYFMDPRNYLNEKYIFAFETLTYSNNQTLEVVDAIIRPQRFWNRLYSNGSVGASNDIVNSSKNVGISAVHVASRIKQEMGNSDYSGDSRVGGGFTYDGVGKSGYYNFFNIKSWSGRGSSIYASYAYENGWDSPTKGIQGGASFMYNGYISVNQDTIYYEKFDVSTNDGHYTHQYMQNLAAPVQEGGIKYTGYKNENASYLGTGITFVVPVYNNMTNYVVTAPRVGNPNNYLSAISVNGDNIPNFSYNTYNYNVYLNAGTKSVSLGANKYASTSVINGIGNIDINSDEQNNVISVVAGNGRARNYNIHFVREKTQVVTPSNPSSDTSSQDSITQNNDNQNSSQQDSNTVTVNQVSYSDVMNHSGFKYNGDYLFGINVGTNVSSIIGNVSSYHPRAVVTIESSSGVSKTNDSFRTGDKVTVKGTDGSSKVYTAIIYGDISGDGLIDKSDLLYVQSRVFGYTSFDSVKNKAADINHDDKVDKSDLLYLQSHVFGYSKIQQG